MAEHGGRRDRAGRPCGVREARKRRRPEDIKNDGFDKKAAEALPELFDTILAIARGVKVGVYRKPRDVESEEHIDDRGERIYVYTTPPDKTMAAYLVDRASGRAAVKSPDQTDSELILEVFWGEKEEEDSP
jgi:hypothetical protein